MKSKDIPVFEKRILEMLPVKQVDVWKTLGISSQDGADIVEIMIKEKLVKRSPLKASRTYLIDHYNNNGCVKPKSNPFGALLSGNQFSPCTGCQAECRPESCRSLGSWVIAKPST